MKDTASTIEEYLAHITCVEAQASLLMLRAIIRSEIPDARECISYGMPGYKLNGYIFGFAAFKIITGGNFTNNAVNCVINLR